MTRTPRRFTPPPETAEVTIPFAHPDTETREGAAALTAEEEAEVRHIVAMGGYLTASQWGRRLLATLDVARSAPTAILQEALARLDMEFRVASGLYDRDAALEQFVETCRALAATSAGDADGLDAERGHNHTTDGLPTYPVFREACPLGCDAVRAGEIAANSGKRPNIAVVDPFAEVAAMDAVEHARARAASVDDEGVHEHYWVDASDDETGWHCTVCGLTEYPGDPGIGPDLVAAALCPATREAVEEQEERGEVGCPLCGRPSQMHRDD
jgi:rubrerythrin